MTHKIKKTLPQIQQTLDTVCTRLENTTEKKTIHAAIDELRACSAAIESLREIPPYSEIHLIRELVASAMFYRKLILRAHNFDEEIEQLEERTGRRIKESEHIINMLGYILQDMLDDEEDFIETCQHARMLLSRFGFDVDEDIDNHSEEV
jgi:hypothetical protein